MRSKPLADDAECPFVRNIFVIFSRITLSFKKSSSSLVYIVSTKSTIRTKRFVISIGRQR